MPCALLSLPEALLQRIVGFSLDHERGHASLCWLARTCKLLHRMCISFSAWSPQLGLLPADPLQDRVQPISFVRVITADFLKRHSPTFDLVNAQSMASAPLLCLRRPATIDALRRLIALSFGLRFFRLIVWVFRKNGTFRTEDFTLEQLPLDNAHFDDFGRLVNVHNYNERLRKNAGRAAMDVEHQGHASALVSHRVREQSFHGCPIWSSPIEDLSASHHRAGHLGM